MTNQPEMASVYEAAVLEVDTSKRANDVEAAIFQKLQILDRNPEHAREGRALKNAINGLRVLRKDRLDQE